MIADLFRQGKGRVRALPTPVFVALRHLVEVRKRLSLVQALENETNTMQE